MSPRTRILSLNLGTHTIGLAEFHALPNGGLLLNGYRSREILVEPSNETARNANSTTTKGVFSARYEAPNAFKSTRSGGNEARPGAFSPRSPTQDG